jgi:exodeoxyribonuclease VII small subunit
MARKADTDSKATGAAAVAPSAAHQDGQSRGRVSSRGQSKAEQKQGQQGGEEGDEIAGSLSFREAQAALELCLAQLQASDLDVERMAELYHRAESYARRCERLLDQVEQDVMQWDPEGADAPPRPLQN